MKSIGALCKVALLLTLACAAVAAQAATVTDLYEAEVGMAGADEQARGDAELRALEAVLVKLTGTRNVDVLSALALHDGPLRDLVAQFQTRGGNSDQPRRLWVRFDERQLDGLLARSEIPVWGRTRPRTAVMLAVNDGQSQRMLAAGDNSGFAAALNGAASSRGIPVVLPLMDLQDARQLRPVALLAGDATGVDAVANRYRGEAVVHGGLVATASGWRLDWTLKIGDERRTRSQSGAPDTLLELLANAIADELAARFMVPLTSTQAVPAPTPVPAGGTETADASAQSTLSTGMAAAALASNTRASSAPAAGSNTLPPALETLGADGVQIDILGVRSVADYGTVLDYLQSLDFVEHLHVRGVHGDTLSVSVRARGGAALLRQTLDIGHTLRAVSGDGRAYQLR